MKLYNTLSRKTEELKPIEKGKVQLYTCGPTVYDFAHIGNLRTYVFEDVLRRSIEFNDFEVNHVMNITDVDDKTIKAGAGKKDQFEKLTRQFENAFFADLKKLNIKKAGTITRATKYVEQMVVFVKELLDKGFAYKGEDGSIYFSIKKFKNYGKLSKIDLDQLKVGARVDQDEYSKENPADFVLWKAWDKDDGDVFWEYELGKGRPGWHIECSAMSQDVLGETIDIHTGGVDNIFPHHENEIAQSEARTGKEFVKIWIHGEHLLVDGKKMSKSLGNFYKLKDIEKKGFSPLDFRYLVIQSHYRSKLNFTWEALEAAANSRKRLSRVINKLINKRTDDQTSHSELAVPLRSLVRGVDSESRSRSWVKAGMTDKKYLKRFRGKIDNDLNTPEALAVVWALVRDQKVSDEEKVDTIQKMEEILALDLLNDIVDEIPEEIKKLAKERDEARTNKEFDKADEIRDKILEFGYIVEDGSDRTVVTK